MKKYRFFSLILALLLLFGSCLGVWADEPAGGAPAEAEMTSELPESETASQEETEPEETEPEETAPRFRDYSNVFAAEEPYEADCKSALLVEMGTNTILYSLEPDEMRYPASLTKIMTCLVAIEKCAERGKSLDDMVTVTESAYADLDPASSTAGIQPGDVISLRELLYCLMLQSANESANIVAEYLAGDVGTYVSWMNERAQQLGCTGTHYANPHGLHDPNHYTTARDLAIIAETALENEEFCALIAEPVYEIQAEQYSGTRTLITTNSLLLQNTEYYYGRARGIKTGYTSAAGRCLITTASDGNLKLLAIVLGTEDNEFASDGLRYRSFVEAKKLLEYGFDSFDFVQVLSRLDMTAQVVVTGGDANSVVLYPSRDINCLLPEGYDKEKITTTWSLDGGATKLTAPVEAGQKVGTIRVSYQNVEIASTTLETLTAIKALNTVESMASGASGFFKSTLPKLLKQYWWVLPAIFALIVLLFAVLIIRNAIVRKKRREAMRRKRQQQRRQQQQQETRR